MENLDSLTGKYHRQMTKSNISNIYITISNAVYSYRSRFRLILLEVLLYIFGRGSQELKQTSYERWVTLIYPNITCRYFVIALTHFCVQPNLILLRSNLCMCHLLPVEG